MIGAVIAVFLIGLIVFVLLAASAAPPDAYPLVRPPRDGELEP